MTDTVLLSAKMLGSIGFAALFALSDFVVSQIPAIDNAFTQYGLLGAVCLLLIYAIRTLFSINQSLQKDSAIERQQAAKDRLADRDMFFERLEKHFEAGQETRKELIDSNKETANAVKILAEQMRNCGLKKPE